MSRINILEISSDCAEVALSTLGRYNPKMFPQGLLKQEDNGDFRYTEKAQDVFNELQDVYENILEEHLNLSNDQRDKRKDN